MNSPVFVGIIPQYLSNTWVIVRPRAFPSHRALSRSAPVKSSAAGLPPVPGTVCALQSLQNGLIPGIRLVSEPVPTLYCLFWPLLVSPVSSRKQMPRWDHTSKRFIGENTHLGREQKQVRKPIGCGADLAFVRGEREGRNDCIGNPQTTVQSRKVLVRLIGNLWAKSDW